LDKDSSEVFDLKPTSRMPGFGVEFWDGHHSGTPDGHIKLEAECLDRLYLNGYIGKFATGLGLSSFMRDQLGKPVPSPVVLGQVSERFRQAVKVLAEREGIPIYQFDHKERKDDIANNFRQQRPLRDGIVFIGVAQEKAKTSTGRR
jgi:hypothetical protein